MELVERAPISKEAEAPTTPGAAAVSSMMARSLRWAARSSLALMVAGTAIWVLAGKVDSLTFGDMRNAIGSITAGQSLATLFLATVSFLALSAQDAIAVRVAAPGKVTIRKALFAGACANAVAGTLGFHALTASAVRYRLYRSAGASQNDVAAIISISSAAVLVSFPVTFSCLGLWSGASAGFVTDRFAVWFGVAFGCLVGLGLAWLAGNRKRFAFRHLAFDLPPATTAACQMAIGAVEMTAAIGALYVLLPTGSLPSFPVFAFAYIAAVIGGLASHVPGGLGVFEAAMLAFLRSDAAGIVGALLAYRLLYSLLPFALAVTALAVHEFLRRRRRALS